MDEQQNYTWEEQPQQWQMPPIRTPKPAKKRRPWLAIVLIIAVAVLAGLGVSEALKDWDLSVVRNDSSVQIRIGEKQQPLPQEPLPASEPIEQPQQPVEEKPQEAASPNETRLQLAAPVAGAENASSDAEGALSLQAIYVKMIPSVVSVSTDGGTGTGIIMSEDGYIITNHHVIANARQIVVMTHDEQTYPAERIGSDETSDLAVLKIEPKTALTAAEFGDSDALRVGDSVVAIGDPLGVRLRGTMTDGIVSAINRDLMVNDREMTLIQTNAALNNGNSGGPLINCYGQVVGINEVKLSNYYSTTIEGLGFAIPISIAKPIIDELIEKGYVAGRPAIGISGEQLPMAVRAFYGLPDGVYITYVSESSDAYQKGIRKGDILTAVEGTPVTTVDEMNQLKNSHIAGDTIRVTVFRAGNYYDVQIVLMDEALQ